MVNIIEFLRKIIPYEVSGITLRRFGRDYDGGYLVPTEAMNTDACISFGIADDVSYEEGILADKEQSIYCFDPTVDKVPFTHSQYERFFYFEKKAGVDSELQAIITDARKNRKRIDHPFFENCYNCPWDLGTEDFEKKWDMITLDEIFDKYQLQDKKIGLKMDIEGSEYVFFQNINKKILKNIQYIVMEIHWLTSEYFLTKADELLDILLKDFTLVHVHANNSVSELYVQSQQPELYNDIYFACLFELTFVNNSFVSEKKANLSIAHPLDRPCAKFLPENRLNYPKEIEKLDNSNIDCSNFFSFVKEKRHPIKESIYKYNTHSIIGSHYKMEKMTTFKESLKKCLLRIGYIPFGKIYNYLKYLDNSRKEASNKIAKLESELTTLRGEFECGEKVDNLLSDFPDLKASELGKSSAWKKFTKVSPCENVLLEDMRAFIEKEDAELFVDLECSFFTIYLAQALKQKGKGHVICLEHDVRRACLLRDALEHLNLISCVTIKILPLIEYKLIGVQDSILWYQLETNTFMNTIDVLILDNFETLEIGSTYASIPILDTFISNNTSVFLHRINSVIDYAFLWSCNYKNIIDKIDRWIS